MRKTALLLTLSTILSACASATPSALPSAGSPPVRDAGRRHGPALTIRIPARVKRHSRYISPSTKSLALSLTPAAGCTACTPASSKAYGLTATSDGCSTNLGTGVVTCVIPLVLAPGSYTGSITTYDGALNSQNQVTGNALSRNQSFPMSIAAGKADVPNITLDGIPAGLRASPLNPGYLQGSVASLKLWGSSTQTLNVTAYDADGNTILGAGAPAITGTSGSGTLVVTNPLANAPNVVEIRATAAGSPAVVTPGVVDVTLSASPAGGGSPVKAVVPVTIAHSAVFTAGNLKSGGALAVEGFYDGNLTTPNVTITSSSFSSISGSGITTDRNGALYVCFGTTNIWEFAASAFSAGGSLHVTPTTTLTNTLGHDCTGLAIQGNVIYDASSGHIDEILAGSAGAPAISIADSDHPVGIALDSNGDIFTLGSNGAAAVHEFANNSGNSSAPIATISGSNTALDFNAGEGIAVDALGTVYVASGDAQTITEFKAGANGNVSPNTTVVLQNGTYSVTAEGLAIDALGNLFVIAPSVSGEELLKFAGSSNGPSSPLSAVVQDMYPDSITVVPAAIEP